MKILIHSYAYSPSRGGIEITSERLAGYWAAQGHEVKLITWTESARQHKDELHEKNTDYEIFRRPSIIKQLQLAFQADVVWQNHVSLRLLFPALILGKRIVVTIQTWLAGQEGTESLPSAMKRIALRFVRPVAISKAIRDHVKIPSIPVIYNPVPISCEVDDSRIAGRGKFLFVGRLVSDKGVDLLLKAFSRLHAQDSTLRLTIVGDGPERSLLEKQASPLGDAVAFTGSLNPEEVRVQMKSHQVLVIPSRWKEPLGIVALEGLSAGCRVIASRGGGLAELEPYRVQLFESGKVEDLVKLMHKMQAEHKPSPVTPEFEKCFSLASVGDDYLELFKSCES